ncbi:11197_t:CDS:2, partial [Diversispora eburnea]
SILGRQLCKPYKEEEVSSGDKRPNIEADLTSLSQKRYYDKLKAIWYTCEAGQNIILTLDDENDLIYKNILQYLTLFDQIIEEYSDVEEGDDNVVIKKKHPNQG